MSAFKIKILEVLQFILYFFAIMYNQSKIVPYYQGEKSQKAVDWMHVWLLYECFIFYFYIIAIWVFVMFTRVFDFNTLRDRANIAGDIRHNMDFLDYCRNDSFWFCVNIVQFLLQYVAFKFDKTATLLNLFDPFYGLAFIVNLLNLSAIYLVFFFPRNNFSPLKAVRFVKYVTIITNILNVLTIIFYVGTMDGDYQSKYKRLYVL